MQRETADGTVSLDFPPSVLEDLAHSNEKVLPREILALIGVSILQYGVRARPSGACRPAVCGKAEGGYVKDVGRCLVVLAAAEHCNAGRDGFRGVGRELVDVLGPSSIRNTPRDDGLAELNDLIEETHGACVFGLGWCGRRRFNAPLRVRRSSRLGERPSAISQIRAGRGPTGRPLECTEKKFDAPIFRAALPRGRSQQGVTRRGGRASCGLRVGSGRAVN